MAATTKFSVAIHVAAVLACRENEYVCSEQIADSVNANPVIVRKILGELNHAGLIEGRLGKHGGSRLARCPHEINLADIWAAVEGHEIFSIHRYPQNQGCHISCCLKELLVDVATRSQSALQSELRQTTLANFISPMIQTSNAAEPPIRKSRVARTKKSAKR